MPSNFVGLSTPYRLAASACRSQPVGTAEGPSPDRDSALHCQSRSRLNRLGQRRLGVKTLAGSPVQGQYLLGRHHARLETQQSTAIRELGVPAGGEKSALPAVHWDSANQSGQIGHAYELAISRPARILPLFYPTQSPQPDTSTSSRLFSPGGPPRSMTRKSLARSSATRGWCQTPVA